MKQRLIFTFITAAAYPLLVWVIMPLAIPFMVTGGSDAMGNGMEKGFTYIYGSMFFSVVLLALSMIVAHFLFRQWWMGIVATAARLLLTWGCYKAYNICEDYRLSSYTHYHYEGGEMTHKVEETEHLVVSIADRRPYTGTLDTECPYTHGERHGIQREYNTSGTLQQETLYVNDVRTEGE